MFEVELKYRGTVDSRKALVTDRQTLASLVAYGFLSEQPVAPLSSRVA